MRAKLKTIRFIDTRVPSLTAIFLFVGLLLTQQLVAGPAAPAEAEKTGGWRLGLESSPYLSMHADNPVEWYPWGEEAFARAKAENKPLFISIGYFTCHWCHVMERESFANPVIAKILNEHFISIKIDREQRPDLDAAYMDFVQATTGRGGWPMSVWATPDGNPFLGGTYFPPQRKYGRPGMKELLPKIHQRWKDEEAELLKMSARVVKQLQQSEARGTPLAEFSADMPLHAQRLYREQYDEFHGGFGSAPKFPEPGQLLFLLTRKQGEDMALNTLDHMAAGGIYDHLAGGFHRYSTDPGWKVPHFEKMIYDQALIVRPYLRAFEKTAKPAYGSVAREVLNFTIEQMRDPQGGFYSALSADSPVPGSEAEHMEEGAFYGWTADQWATALEDKTLRSLGAAFYGVTPNGNVHGGELAGSNVLYRDKTLKELAKKFGRSEDDIQKQLDEVNQKLLQARRQRPPVPVDDKIVTVWNGYMITSLVMADKALKEPRYIRAALKTAEFILTALYDQNAKILYRDWRKGVRGVAGFAEDYGGVAEGFLALYESTGDKKWLVLAAELTDLQIAYFWDKERGGFFGVTEKTRLWVRNKDATDGVTPSPNAVAIRNMLRLGVMTGRSDYTRRAIRTGKWVGGLLRRIPYTMPYTLLEWPALIEATRIGASSHGPTKILSTGLN